MSEFLEAVTLKDLIYSVVGIITVFSVIVEKMKSLPFKPWTHLFEWVGKCITNNMNDRLLKIEEQQKANIKAIKEVEEKFTKKLADRQRDSDEKEAKRLRANIIEFADSCRVGNHHTQTHFENVMRDYSDYVEYCSKHKIPNHFIDSEYRYIEDIYRECLRENKFL